MHDFGFERVRDDDLDGRVVARRDRLALHLRQPIMLHGCTNVLHVARCPLHLACCMLPTACCTLDAARCILRVARCTILVACCTAACRDWLALHCIEQRWPLRMQRAARDAPQTQMGNAECARDAARNVQRAPCSAQYARWDGATCVQGVLQAALDRFSGGRASAYSRGTRGVLQGVELAVTNGGEA